ncbi:MAG: hypothetical protein ACYSWU_26200 [Planctomycetota bacterium]
MKRIVLILSAVALLAGLNGCCWPRCSGIRDCLLGHCGGCAHETGCGSCCPKGCEVCGPDASCQQWSRPGAKLCEGCGVLGCMACRGHGGQAFTPGPPSATITYPYYTSRGPRDFLAENPPSIGP